MFIMLVLRRQFSSVKIPTRQEKANEIVPLKLKNRYLFFGNDAAPQCSEMITVAKLQ